MSLIEYEECVITGSILPPSVKRQETDINKSGIYKIINRTNGHYYVGSAGKVRNRWNDHKRFLRQNRHPNSHLQYAWNKYGSDAFEFIFVKSVEKLKLEEEEQKYLDVALMEKDKSYNIAFDSYCSTRGVPMSNAQKVKVSSSLKNYFSNPDALEKHRMLCRNKSHGEKISLSKIQREKYTFQHIKTGEFFTGTKRDFYMKVGTYKNLCLLLKKSRKTIKGWKLV